MRSALLVGLFALIPAAFNPASAAAPVSVALCTGDGAPRMLNLPVLPGNPPASETCCAKGCHAGGARKRKPGHI